jgi:predicted nuclease of predicted toxin-antitoxin system
MTIRFHLDESVTTAIAGPLRQRGIDVTTPTDASLLGATDEEHLALARQQHRIVVTHDVDYLRLHQSGAEHAGIVYCHQSKYSEGELLQMLLLVHACYTAEQIDGHVEYV